MSLRRRSCALILATCVAGSSHALPAFLAAVQPLAYSEFHALLLAGHLHDLEIGEDQIEGQFDAASSRPFVSTEEWQAIEAAGTPALMYFTVARVNDPNLLRDLEAAHVRYQGVHANRWLNTFMVWLLPTVLFVGVWILLARRMGMSGAGSLASVGKSNARIYNVQKGIEVRFADVEGIDEAKIELIEVVDFLKHPDQYRRLGGRIPKGVLIVGAPGTGKTLLAKAVAGEAQVPFLSMSGSEFVEMFVGVGAARVRDLFQQAEALAPCIIFIDELDALGKARGEGWSGGHDEREQTLNQLLVEMDGFDANKGVIIMAATNRPEILDPALLRPGRFDRHVAIDKPDLQGRRRILEVHAKRVLLAADVDLGEVAAKTPGCAGADLANIVNEAALHAARNAKMTVEKSDFEYAIDRALTGLEKRSRVMNEREKRTVAYHEAGHAIIAETRRTCDPVAKISIIPRGIGALGFTQQMPTEDRYLLKRSELLERLEVLLGGREAEQLALGEVSTGAQDDLQRATDLVRHMVAQYGMSDALGPAVVDVRPQPAFFRPPTYPSAPSCSELTWRRIDREVASILASAEARVRQTLQEYRSQLDVLAGLLLEHETVQRSEFLQALERGPQAAVSEGKPAMPEGKPAAPEGKPAAPRPEPAASSP